jgi:hypothetical protein
MLGIVLYPILTQYCRASPVELGNERSRQVSLLLSVESLLAFKLSATITAVIAGVLFMSVWLAKFGTKVGFMVSAAPAGTLLISPSAFVGFHWKP